MFARACERAKRYAGLNGVMGGSLIILGEDFGEGSSIPQERSHAFAMKSQMWLLDPRPNLESIVKAVEDGFELSETSNTPVITGTSRVSRTGAHFRYFTTEIFIRGSTERICCRPVVTTLRQ